jgi:hypothetical protein
MDPKRFDAISQRLGAIGDRRRMLGALGALTAISLPAAEVDAKRCIKTGGYCEGKQKKKDKRHKRQKPNKHELCNRTNCCSGCFKKPGSNGIGRCTCCRDGVVPKNGLATNCCSKYINTSTGACQTTCDPGCAKCCPPVTGSTTPHCGTPTQTCCPSSLGGGACTTGSECCNTPADCPNPKTCIAGCCL